MDYMRWEDIGRASDVWIQTNGQRGTAWDEFAGKHLPLPSWFDKTLDPLSDAYAQQQDRVWQLIVGSNSDYNPLIDELTSETHPDPLLRPGLYGETAEMAGNHLMALGHLVKLSGFKPGARVLEYGAGY